VEQVLVADNHCHLNPVKGLGLKAVKRFKKSGGWFMCVVNLLSWSYDISITRAEDYAKLYEKTIEIAEEARKLGVKTAVIIGPHPAELVKLSEKVELLEAEQIIRQAYELASKYIREGLADGLGEVGRPHWNTSREVVEACNRVLDYVLLLSRDLDCVVHLHLEQKGLQTVDDIHARVRRIGARRIVFHHAEPNCVKAIASRKMYASITGKKNFLLEAIRQTEKFVVESDFLDDPRRPGAVIAPWSIASTTKKLLNQNIIDYDKVYKIHVDNIKEIYDIEL